MARLHLAQAQGLLRQLWLQSDVAKGEEANARQARSQSAALKSQPSIKRG